MNGNLDTSGGRPSLRFERILPHPAPRVWQALTVPAELGSWFPAAADWTPEAGETFEAGGATGQITELEPSRVIEWTFGGDLFRFDLLPGDDSCSLRFLHVFDDQAMAAQTAAGWECYLDRLEAKLRGEELPEERAHEPIGERHEWFAKNFCLDPTPGRTFIATALDFRGLTLEGGPVLRLTRRYDQSIDRMWQALADPSELRNWFPGELEVMESDPPHHLVGSWQGDGELQFDLTPDGEGSALIFTHTFADRDQAALAAAGWDRCFARLDAVLADSTMSEADALATWLDVHDRLAAIWDLDPGIGREMYAKHSPV